MKFRKFVDWCNERACDGAWGMNEAMICINAHQYVKQGVFGRKKRWETIWPEIEHIVAAVNRRRAACE